MYSSEFQLNKANTSDTKAVFLDLHFSVSNDIVSTKIYNKYGGFDHEIVSFPFLDGDVTHSTSYGFYIIRCTRASSHVADFNSRKNINLNKPICIINFANVFLKCIGDALT